MSDAFIAKDEEALLELNMLFEEWDWERYVVVQRREGREEGHTAVQENGIVLDKEFALKSAIYAIANPFSPEEIAKRFNVPADFVMSALNNA